MCRHAAYLGSPITLYKLLFEPDHNLEKQAWQPRELREAVLNADGFGAGWYNQDRQPACYRLPIPIWNDPNLRNLSQSMSRPLWLASVRSATPGLGTHQLNTQPFQWAQWLFMHNGYVRDFATTLRPYIRQIIDNTLEAGIQGNTDSEYLFALFLHFEQDLDNPVAAIESTFEFIHKHAGNNKALLNLLVCDGETIYATRHANNGECPSLYYASSLTDFPQDSHIIASERFDESDRWKPIIEHNIAIITNDKPATFLPL